MMMRGVRVWGICLALAPVAGCTRAPVGTDGPPGNPDAAALDTFQVWDIPAVDCCLPPDLDSHIPANVGDRCTESRDCSPRSPLCLTYTNLFGWVTKSRGICSLRCTPDDKSTPLVDEDDCPRGSHCAYLGSAPGPPKPCKDCYCLMECTPSLSQNPCPTGSGTTCHPESSRWHSEQKNLCIWPACETHRDCPVQGTTLCTRDADCKKLGSDGYCYFSDAGAASGTCAVPGTCTASGLCGPHTRGQAGSGVGDPCKSDLDCPGNGRCLQETSGSGAIGVHNHNGYCVVPWCSHEATLPAYACPAGSTCHRLYHGGMCFRSCRLQSKSDCRGNGSDRGGDYECYAWNNLTLSASGLKVANGPLCESAANWACDRIGATLTCANLGLSDGNSTHMVCRDRATGARLSNKKDPAGVCLDDTASGPF
jgi:hypothetical protein